MRDYRDAKAMAQTLRQALKERSVSLTHSESLELIAKVLGFADWNVLSARIQAEPAPAAAAPATPSEISRPVLPLRDIVLFPQMTTPIYAMRLKSIAAIERAMAGEKEIFFATQRRMADDDPKAEGLHQVGVIASVIQLHKQLDGSIQMMVNGLRRAKVLGIDSEDACLVARLAPIQEVGALEDEAAAVAREVLQCFETYANITLAAPPQALIHLSHLRDPGRIADALAQHLSFTIDQRQLLLQTANVIDRLKTVLAFMNSEPKAA